MSAAENISFGILIAGVVILVVSIVALCFLIVKRKEQLRCQRRTELRRLWYDHVVYTRLYLMARFSKTPADQYAARLLRNQQEIGAAFAAKYGRAAGEHVTKLLTDHITGAVAIVDAMLLTTPERQSELEAALAAWLANGAQIASALGKLNPKRYSAHEAQHMMLRHLALTVREASLLETNGSAGSASDIDNFDRTVTEIQNMADWIAQGL